MSWWDNTKAKSPEELKEQIVKIAAEYCAQLCIETPNVTPSRDESTEYAAIRIEKTVQEQSRHSEVELTPYLVYNHARLASLDDSLLHAIVAHELAHLKFDTIRSVNDMEKKSGRVPRARSFVKESEFRADRIAVLLTRSPDAYIKMLSTIQKNEKLPLNEAVLRERSPEHYPPTRERIEAIRTFKVAMRRMSSQEIEKLLAPDDQVYTDKSELFEIKTAMENDQWQDDVSKGRDPWKRDGITPKITR